MDQKTFCKRMPDGREVYDHWSYDRHYEGKTPSEVSLKPSAEEIQGTHGGCLVRIAW